MYSEYPPCQPLVDKDRMAFVFFTNGSPGKAQKLTARRLWFSFLSWAVRTGTRSPLAHVSIGVDGPWGQCVLDVLFGRRRNSRGCVGYWPIDAYRKGCPGMVCRFDVPLTADPLMSAAEGIGPKRSWSVFWWWATRGRTNCGTSCVRIVSDRLRAGGLDVPRLVTPQQLHDWLASQGFRKTSLNDQEAANHPQASPACIQSPA